MFFEQGDIIFVDLSSSQGHEQAGFRPVVIISNNEYNRLMDLYIVCPITNNNKKFPTHIQLDDRTKTTGSILCEHVRTVDLKARKKSKKVEECPKDILKQVLAIIGLSLELPEEVEENLKEDIKQLPTVGYIDEDGYTVLPKEENE